MDIQHIIVHHTLFTEAEKQRLINYGTYDYSLNRKRYHKIINYDGSIELGSREGSICQPCEGINEISLNVCVEGNFNKEELSESKENVLVMVLTSWCVAFDLSPQCIRGHHFVPEYKTNTSCPGINIIKKLDRIRYQVSKNIKVREKLNKRMHQTA